MNSLPTFCGPPAHPLPTFPPLPLLLGLPPGKGPSSWLRPLRGGSHITAVTLCAGFWAACLSPNCPLCYQAWFMPDIYKVSGFVHLWDFNGASPWHQAWTKASRVTETFVGAPRNLDTELWGQGLFAPLVEPQTLKKESLEYSIEGSWSPGGEGQRYPRPLPLSPNSPPGQRLSLES